MKREYLVRQEDTLPYEKVSHLSITVIGVGAIGSFTTLSLAKMGLENIDVIDHDVVSDENMNVQFYPLHTIGQPKVDALEELVKSFTGACITDYQKRWDSDDTLGEVVITSLDNMATRKEVFEKAREEGVRCLIDPRMAIESLMVLSTNPSDPEQAEWYEKFLYSDEEAIQERCTNKAVMYTVLSAAGIVCQMVKDYVSGKRPTRIVQWDLKSMHATGLDGNFDN